MIPRAPRSTLFPYTTLFRSSNSVRTRCKSDAAATSSRRLEAPRTIRILSRSEEHTSELQSRVDLVCRLLLEKKKSHANKLRQVTHEAHERLCLELQTRPQHD